MDRQITVINDQFKPRMWVLAGGLLGFLILVFLPSANAKEIDEETIARRRKNGNTAGGIITALAIIVVIVTIGVLSSH